MKTLLPSMHMPALKPLEFRPDMTLLIAGLSSPDSDENLFDIANRLSYVGSSRNPSNVEADASWMTSTLRVLPMTESVSIFGPRTTRVSRGNEKSALTTVP